MAKMHLRWYRGEAWNAQSGLCFYCAEPTPLELSVAEHFLARSKGGKNHRRNIVAACHACDKRKGIMSADEFVLSIAFMCILRGRGRFCLLRKSRSGRTLKVPLQCGCTPPRIAHSRWAAAAYSPTPTAGGG